MKTTKSCNKRYDKARKVENIIATLKRHPEGANIKTISFETDIEYATIRGYMRELKGNGIIRQKYTRGPYYLVETSTDSIEKLRMQNITLTYTPKSNVTKRVDFTKDLGITTVRLESGIKSNKITYHVYAENPITIREAYLIGYLFTSEITNLMGESPLPSDIIVATAEFNHDYSNMRIEGVNCITLDNVLALEKLYNKQHDVRHEIKTKIPFSLSNLKDILSNGIQHASLASKLELMDSKLDKLVKGNKSLLGWVFRKVKTL